jgi:hypothetical protein
MYISFCPHSDPILPNWLLHIKGWGSLSRRNLKLLLIRRHFRKRHADNGSLCVTLICIDCTWYSLKWDLKDEFSGTFNFYFRRLRGFICSLVHLLIITIVPHSFSHSRITESVTRLTHDWNYLNLTAKCQWRHGLCVVWTGECAHAHARTLSHRHVCLKSRPCSAY